MQEFGVGFGILVIYFVVCASAALLLRRFVGVSAELFRKILHGILLGSLLVFTFGFSTWWKAASASLIFAVVVYPILSFAEKFEGYSKLLTERKGGEIKSSLLVVFSMFTIVICICWGWLDDKMLLLASVYAWGFGDAAAALVGKRFGKHTIEGRFVEGKKSVEGTLAMFAVSFVCVLILLVLRGNLVWYGYLITAAVAAVVSAAVELYTKNGMDTISCPLAAMAVLLPLVTLFGGMS